MYSAENEPCAIEKRNEENENVDTDEYQENENVEGENQSNQHFEEYENGQYIEEEYLDEDYEEYLSEEEDEEESFDEYGEEYESDEEWEKSMNEYYNEFSQISCQQLFEAESDNQDEDNSMRCFQSLTIRNSGSRISCLLDSESETNLTESNEQVFTMSKNDPEVFKSKALTSLVPSDYPVYTPSSSECTKTEPRAPTLKKPLWSGKYPLDMPSTSSCTKINMPLTSYSKYDSKPKVLDIQ